MEKGQVAAASQQHIPLAAALVDIRRQSLKEGIGGAGKGDGMERKGKAGQLGEKIPPNPFLMENPAEDHVFIAAVLKESPKQVLDVAHHHGSIFFVDRKGFHVPAPVPVQKSTGG